MNYVIRLYALAAPAILMACAAHARILQETVVLPQCEFYPLRDQDRGYLCRYVDQPLSLDPDLPEDPPHPTFETRRHRYWGEWWSQADWNACEREGKESFFDGHAFFPRPHRVRYWDGMEHSPVTDFNLVPIAYSKSEDGSDFSKWFGYAVRSSRALRHEGKAVILSYCFSNKNDPVRVKMKMDRMRREFGDTFKFICDISKQLANTDSTLADGCVKPATMAGWKELARSYLRVCDGVAVFNAYSVVGFEGPARNRVFNTIHYEGVAKAMREVLDEPEFKGRKLFALGACYAHDNSTIQFWTASEDGLRTITESMRIAMSADPDIILLPEWDEYNENTCVGPTLLNGLTTRRLMNFYQSQIKRRVLAPLPGDDCAMPNLVVSCRRNASPGERLLVDVLNVPDGSWKGGVAVKVDVLGDGNEVVFAYPWQRASAAALVHLRFPIDSAALAEKARAPRLRVSWRGNGRGGVVEDGLSPIELQLANAWCLKEVHQPIRDLAPVSLGRMTLKDGVLDVALSCREPIRFVHVLANGEIQRVIGRPGSVADRFREDETHAVFQVYGTCAGHDDRSKFAYRVSGVSEAEWLDWHGAHTGLEFRTDWLSHTGDPYFLRIPKIDVATAVLHVDFDGYFKGDIPLDVPYEEGAAMRSGSKDSQFCVTRFRRQARYPSVLNACEAAFVHPVDRDRPSMAYVVQVVTMSGKTWRSGACIEEASSPQTTARVFDWMSGELRDIRLPTVRVPCVEYDLAPRTGTYLPTKDRLLRFATVLGGRYTPLTLWNRTSYSGTDFPETYRAMDGKADKVPKRVHEVDGSWSLAFDGKDDIIAFPWECIPQNSAYCIGMEINPRAVDGNRLLLTAKGLIRAEIEDGVVVVSACGAVVQSNRLLVPGIWQRLEIIHTGRALVVRVDGHETSVAARLPATFMSPAVLKLDGRLRSLVFDHHRPDREDR